MLVRYFVPPALVSFYHNFRRLSIPLFNFFLIRVSLFSVPRCLQYSRYFAACQLGFARIFAGRLVDSRYPIYRLAFRESLVELPIVTIAILSQVYSIAIEALYLVFGVCGAPISCVNPPNGIFNLYIVSTPSRILCLAHLIGGWTPTFCVKPPWWGVGEQSRLAETAAQNR